MEKEAMTPSCEFLHAHGELVERLKKQMPSEDALIDLSELFKIFGDSTRIKILYALLGGELCVCDIAALLSMTVSAISHQLRILRAAKLVVFRREGKTVFYSLADDHVRTILDMGMEHILE
ncbi:MAG: helix-turn-helix transcriptional regulator [Clostridia bacterium]|nr:helix-turn-helix transcriptional regulator [Clostridia bacterium]